MQLTVRSHLSLHFGKGKLLHPIRTLAVTKQPAWISCGLLGTMAHWLMGHKPVTLWQHRMQR